MNKPFMSPLFPRRTMAFTLHSTEETLAQKTLVQEPLLPLLEGAPEKQTSLFEVNNIAPRPRWPKAQGQI